MAGHYPMPKDAKVHQILIQEGKHEEVYNITCEQDDRIQLWFHHKTKPRKSDEGIWYMALNEEKMKIYQEFMDNQQTDKKGLKGDAYKLLDRSKSMTSQDHE